MPDNILYGVMRENLNDPDSSKMVEMSKDREKARKAVVGRNSLNKDKNIKYTGVVVQMDTWKVLGPFTKRDCRK